MDTWSVSEVVLVPIMPSEQIAKVLDGMLTLTKEAGRELGKKGEWAYVTATYDGANTIQIYENGVEVGPADVGKPPPQSEAEVHLEDDKAIPPKLLDGLLDKVAIFNVALSPADMKALMKKGFEAIGNTTNVDPMNKLATSWADIKSR